MTNLGELRKASSRRKRLVMSIDVMIAVLIIFLLLFIMLGFKFDSENFARFAISFLIAFIAGMAFFILNGTKTGITIGGWLLGVAIRDADDYSTIPSKERLIKRNLYSLISPFDSFRLLFGKRTVGERKTNTEVINIREKNNPLKNFMVITVVSIIFIVIFASILIQGLKNSDAYKIAVSYIEQNQDINKITGKIQAYRFSGGSISTTGRYGQAYFNIKVKGIENDVRITVNMIKEPYMEWHIQEFNYVVE